MAESVPTRPWKARVRRWLVVAAVPVLGLLTIVVAANVYVQWQAAPYTRAEPTVPFRTWAIVPGNNVERGWPGVVLQSRLAPAAALLARGVVDRILVSGRVRGANDEPAAMRAYLEYLGVPSERITEDPGGYRTFRTAVNAHDAFGIKDAVVVTNPFHLPRSIFLLRSVGIDAVGSPARPLPRLQPWVRARWTLRESLARALAVWDVAVRGAGERSGSPGPAVQPR